MWGGAAPSRPLPDLPCPHPLRRKRPQDSGETSLTNGKPSAAPACLPPTTPSPIPLPESSRRQIRRGPPCWKPDEVHQTFPSPAPAHLPTCPIPAILPLVLHLQPDGATWCIFHHLWWRKGFFFFSVHNRRYFENYSKKKSLRK